MTFQEELQIELTLTLGGQSFSIPGGQVKHVSAHLASHGFTGQVTFWTSLEKVDAPLFIAFQKPDLAQVKLSLTAVDPELESPPPPLVVQGLVRTRRVLADPHGTGAGGGLVFRRYTVDFADPAQVLWRQHRPIELYTNTSMEDVLEAHKASLSLSCDWPALQQKQPLLCLALGADTPGVSFYDFVLWYVDTHGGVWSYDSPKNQYLLAESKPSSGEAAPLGALRVHEVNVQLPPLIRHGTRVLNALANGPTTTALAQPQAAAGVSHDVLLRTPITSEVEAREKLEESRLQPRQRQIDVSFKRFPTMDVFPGALLRLDGPLWPSGLTGLGEDQRVLKLDLEAHAEGEGQHDEQQTTSAPYQVSLRVLAEPSSEPVVALPHYRPPRYPIHVEGLVESPGGQPPDRTYLIVDDSQTSLSYFRMKVPLWNQTVSVSAEPIHFPGQFFFPPYKNTRVLLALHFDRAELLRFIDWKDGVRSAQDGQGDQVLLGKNKTSQTALTHDFQDDKPVWRLHRTSGGDTQLVRMSEGNLFLEVKDSQAGMALTPTYDVSPQVEAAKSDLSTAVGGAVAQTGAAAQGAVAAVTGTIKGATAEMTGALGKARGELGAEVTSAKGALKGAAARLAKGVNAVTSAGEEVKAAFQKLR
ncbi:MAG TPA: hypothetical protein VIG99_06045 [Myxococcaceae bacterium]|jgi:hypothetical protein